MLAYSSGVNVITITIDEKKLKATERRVSKALKLAPGRFLTDNKDGLRKAFSNERRRYVGDKGGKPGKLKKQYMKIIRGKGAGRFKPIERRWQQQAINAAVSGKFHNFRQINGMTLRIGPPTRNPHLARRFSMLDKSYTGRRGFSSSKIMPIPLWRNIANSRFANFPPRGKALSRLISAGEFDMVKRGNQYLYFDPEQRMKSGRYPKKALMMLGVKSVTIEPKTDLIAVWKADRGVIIKRVTTRMNAMARKILRKPSV